MTRIDQNGTPAIHAIAGSLEFQNTIAATFEPAAPSATFGSLVGDSLEAIDGDAIIIVDPNQRRVWVGDDDSTMGTALTAIETEAVHQGTITPDTGQTGRTLTWTAVTTGLSAAFIAAINAAVAQAKPAKTIQSLISGILSHPGILDLDALPVIVVDQIAGNVRVYDMASTTQASTALDALANAGDRVKIMLEEPPEGGSAPAPIFEGGSTGA